MTQKKQCRSERCSHEILNDIVEKNQLVNYFAPFLI